MPYICYELEILREKISQPFSDQQNQQKFSTSKILGYMVHVYQYISTSLQANIGIEKNKHIIVVELTFLIESL